jgi:hypothetical protein
MLTEFGNAVFQYFPVSRNDGAVVVIIAAC